MTGAPSAAASPGLLDGDRRAEKSALAQLLVQCQPRLRGMCWNYLHDPEAVDDVVQDTFCRALERIPRIGAPSNMAAWVYRVAANLCIDELRRRARWSAAEVKDGEGEASLVGVADESWSNRPEEALELDTIRQLVHSAIRALPGRQRDVLILRDVLGRSEVVAARCLGVSTGTVQGLLHRARGSFRDACVAFDSDRLGLGECGEVAFIVEHLDLSSLRRDRLQAIERHLARCRDCDSRYGETIRRAGGLHRAA